MGDAACYSRRLDRAIALATDAFRHTRRKDTDIAYLSHLFQVMVHVAEHGGDEDQLIAAVLHDYLEDIDGATSEGLEREFGPRVARLVAALSDATERPKPPWEDRKRAYLAHLRDAPAEVKLISAADKLHNAQSIRRDLELVGDQVWDRFTATREQTLWYYRELVEALAAGWTSRLLDRLRAEVDALHRSVQE
ncbi:MAG TPA: HD domain-containing protein [Kofleriaceae bacterium]|nr:HD domain-containing protein [Kofleriaceae bacterium]